MLSHIRKSFESMFSYFLPTVRIHSWGGLGSQIFACLVIRRLQIRFPHRRLQLIFHSSGVTRREIEIPQVFLLGLHHSFLDDFQVSVLSGTELVEEPSFSCFKNLVLRFLETSGVLTRLNNERQFIKLKPWILEVRGHYTGLHLSLDEIAWVSKNLDIPGDTPIQTGELSLHLRLGDLLTLKTKTYIPVNRITSTVNACEAVNRILIFSDSTNLEIQAHLKGSLRHPNLKLYNSPAIYVMQKCVASEIFVGTNSKISLWIAILRNLKTPGLKTYLPVEISNQFRQLMTSKPSSSTTFY